MIGAGWSGMLVGKHCRDNGLTVRLIEKSNHMGGVWKYTEDVPGITPFPDFMSISKFLRWKYNESSDDMFL